MRCAFAGSLAAGNAACYAAGVGDRHSSNFLLHTRSGTLVPIDFGCAPCWGQTPRNFGLLSMR